MARARSICDDQDRASSTLTGMIRGTHPQRFLLALFLAAACSDVGHGLGGPPSNYGGGGSGGRGSEAGAAAGGNISAGGVTAAGGTPTSGTEDAGAPDAGNSRTGASSGDSSSG